MEEVNALKIRNNLGEILDRLNRKGEPILISKNRKIRAVLITPTQFERRFLDWQTKDERRRFQAVLKRLKKSRLGNLSTLAVLRKLRGYDQ
ncbi:type II toxin-antitoxin system Phd/YefM family antitoxin [Thermodesulfobacteriota bacterium]